MWLEPQAQEAGIDRVVVVGLFLHAWVGQMVDRHIEAQFRSGALHDTGEIEHTKLLGKLVEDAELTAVGRVEHGQLDAGQGIADIEETAGLTTLTIDGQGHADHCLNQKAVEHRTEDAVIVEAGTQALIEAYLVRIDTIDNPLVQIGGAQPPDPAGEVDIDTIVNF